MPKLYEDATHQFSVELQYDLHQCLKKIYSLCVKTFDLFFKMLKDCWTFVSNNSKVLAKIYYNLAEYAKANFNPAKCKNENNIYFKTTKRIMKMFKKKLYDESVKKTKNYFHICFIIQIIEV